MLPTGRDIALDLLGHAIASVVGAGILGAGALAFIGAAQLLALLLAP